MTDATDYDPVECPVADCTYRDEIRSVAAHVGQTDGDGHSWSRLDYDGARDFVMTEKRRQRGELDSSGTDAGTRSSDEAGSSTADAAVGSAEPDASARSDGSPGPDESDFELGFEREALVLLQLAGEYDLSSLDDLGTYQLADLYSLLADLKNSAEDARKEVRDALLEEVHEDRTIAADLGSVSRRTYEYRRLTDEETVRRALAAADVDPESVRSFDKGKLKDAVEETDLDEDAVFDVEERAQIRISDSNDSSRRRQLDRLDPEIRSLADDRE